MLPVQIKTILFIFLLFIIGALIILVASGYKKGNSKLSSDFWKLYQTEILIVFALLVPAYYGGAFFAIVLLIFNYRAHYEIFHLHGYTRTATLQMTVVYLISSGFVISTFFYAIDYAVVGKVLIFFIISVVLLMQIKSGTSTAVLHTLPAIIIVTLSLCSLVVIRKMENGFIQLLFIYLVSETNDAFALIFGKLFGKRKIFPYISPNKTMEGFLFGVCFAFGTGYLYNMYVRIFPTEQAFVLIIIVLIGAIAGDLIFSVYKRHFNAKDFLPVMIQHGGIIDIYDSMIFASVVFYLSLTVFHLSHAV